MRLLPVLAFLLVSCEPSASTHATDKSERPMRVRVGPSGGPAVRCGDSPVGVDVFSGDIVLMP